MASDINNNNFKNTDMYIPAQKIPAKVQKSAIERTLKNIVAPVFDFFTQENEEKESITFKDYSEEIEYYEMRAANTQRILNDSDPNSRNKLNIVI